MVTMSLWCTSDVFFGKMHTEYLWSVHLFIVCQITVNTRVWTCGDWWETGQQRPAPRQLLESYWQTARVHPILHTSIVAVDDV